MRKNINGHGNRQRDGLCVYCGAPATTDDHVPPRNMFPKAMRNKLKSQLITVESCEFHNNGSSEDDEYFRNVLATRQDAYRHPDAQAVSREVNAAHARSKTVAWRDLKNLRSVPVYSPGGIHLGERHLRDVDRKAVGRVLIRIARGLFFHELGRRLPDSYTLKTEDPLADLYERELQSRRLQVERIVCFCQERQPRIIGDRTFVYWFRTLADQENASGDENAFTLVMDFYDSVRFLVVGYRDVVELGA